MTLSVATAGTRPATAAPPTTLDITVLAGGVGAEREVSRESGRMVGEALGRLKHNVTLRDITPENLSALDVPADVVFIALHGAFGEDGAIQRILDERGIAYTGSGAEASALAMDKVAAKAKFIENAIPTPPFDLIKPARLKRVARNIVLPVVVKPCDSGSSVDTYIIRDVDQLEPILSTVVARYGCALVERYIEGPELTVGILGEKSLPVCEIRTRREFYNYEAKYVDDDTEYLFDIDLPGPLLERIGALSLEAHRALGCRDFSRVDWMVDRSSGEPFALEVNTIPGFTSHSLLPKAAALTDITFDTLCQTVIDLALNRAASI